VPDLLLFLLKYGYVVVFGAAFAEQIGLPVPAAPLLVGMGALSRSGDFYFVGVVATAAVASLVADLIWYNLGRRHGRAVLRLICRISLEPDYCVRRTEDAFVRFGLWALLPAKFIPGLNAAAVPLAGMVKVRVVRFLVFDAAGIVIWTCVYMSLGYVFSQQIERVIDYLAGFGGSLLLVIVLPVLVYVLYKLEQRRRFLSGIAVLRIKPEELKERMDAGARVLILDIRNRLDRDTDPVRIPGAFHILPEHLEFESADIDPDREVVIYCTCPNEATSARVAVRLKRKGFMRARPLQGGLDAWRERNLPVERLD
jgi:membrane protein DedA with SNARE-associated domain/rhodanese-related sulfurtransferase